MKTFESDSNLNSLFNTSNTFINITGENVLVEQLKETIKQKEHRNLEQKQFWHRHKRFHKASVIAIDLGLYRLRVMGNKVNMQNMTQLDQSLSDDTSSESSSAASNKLSWPSLDSMPTTDSSGPSLSTSELTLSSSDKTNTFESSKNTSEVSTADTLTNDSGYNQQTSESSESPASPADSSSAESISAASSNENIEAHLNSLRSRVMRVKKRLDQLAMSSDENTSSSSTCSSNSPRIINVNGCSTSSGTVAVPSSTSSSISKPLAQPHPLSTSITFNNNNSKFFSDLTIPPRLDYLLDLPPCSFEESAKHAWNPDDRSLNIFVKESDPFTLHRHPVAQSTDCIRTKIGYTRGIHLWVLDWNSRQRGTHAIIGVANEKTPLHCVGYQSLIGSGPDSYGWDLGRNRACHNTKANIHTPPPVYPKILKADENFVVPDTFMMCLDMDEGTLSFLADGQFLGVAFRGLKGKKLYPIVSAVWGHCEITMKYVNGLEPNPLPLVDLCRRCIRKEVGKERLNEIDNLNLPNSIKNFLLYRH
jgi:SPRY domain-containing SOCS box protein 1/4